MQLASVSKLLTCSARSRLLGAHVGRGTHDYAQRRAFPNRQSWRLRGVGRHALVFFSAHEPFASPKSSACRPLLMFAGFKSRWMIPFSWAASRPSAIG